ncbi:hypothetical protein U1872_21975 [Sphingomonas sp. RB3P16]|uniref:hypothetical protein n=1 Tax=Parasphingomonas frigoris TaxID=3096163 RepID=UPI002FC9B638
MTMIIETIARDVVEQHKERAGQFVVDQIVAAIRGLDNTTAQHWDAVGKAIEQHSWTAR